MPIIRTYGLHWRLKRVNWGRRGEAGTLLGAASRSARARPVDFHEQRGIYALYADYELVYLGQTGAGNQRLFARLKSHRFARLKSHRSDHLSERWDRFSWFGTQWVTQQSELSQDVAAVHESTEITLNILEAISIAIAEPRLNLQRGRWGEATQYYQWREKPEDEEIFE